MTDGQGIAENVADGQNVAADVSAEKQYGYGCKCGRHDICRC